MIHVVTPANEPLYRREMDQAFRLRHKIFVEERGWKDLEKPDGREIDQFDTPQAVHFLSIDAGEVVGYCRLLPTTKPHILSDVLPHLCEVERPVGPEVWEWTRQAVARGHRTRGKFVNPITLALMTAMVEWGLGGGIARFVVEMPPLYLLHMVQLHYQVRPLGLPQPVSGEDVIAVTADFDARTLARLNAVRGDTASILAPSYAYLAA